MNQLPIKPPNHGIAVNNETIQLPGAKKKKNTKSENSDRLKLSRQPTQPSRTTLLVTPPAAEVERKEEEEAKATEGQPSFR